MTDGEGSPSTAVGAPHLCMIAYDEKRRKGEVGERRDRTSKRGEKLLDCVGQVLRSFSCGCRTASGQQIHIDGTRSRIGGRLSGWLGFPRARCLGRTWCSATRTSRAASRTSSDSTVCDNRTLARASERRINDSSCRVVAVMVFP